MFERRCYSLRMLLYHLSLLRSRKCNWMHAGSNPVGSTMVLVKIQSIIVQNMEGKSVRFRQTDGSGRGSSPLYKFGCK